MIEFIERAQPWTATLILHNWPVIMYAIIGVIAALRAYLFPRRHTLLFLYGTVMLIVAYEYEKHALATVVDTTNYLFSLEVNARARVLSQFLLVTVAPSLLRLVGFALIVGAVTIRERAYRRQARNVWAATLEF